MEIPKVIRDSLLTMHPFQVVSYGDKEIEITYASDDPSDSEPIELRFGVWSLGGKFQGKWQLFAGSGNLPEGHWAHIQQYLRTN